MDRLRQFLKVSSIIHHSFGIGQEFVLTKGVRSQSLCACKKQSQALSPLSIKSHIICDGREPGPHLSLQTWQWPVNKES